MQAMSTSVVPLVPEPPPFEELGEGVTVRTTVVVTLGVGATDVGAKLFTASLPSVRDRTLKRLCRTSIVDPCLSVPLEPAPLR